MTWPQCHQEDFENSMPIGEDLIVGAVLADIIENGALPLLRLRGHGLVLGFS